MAQTGKTGGETSDGGRLYMLGNASAYYLGGIPLVLPVLHGAAGPWDEVVIFGGIGSILIGLAALSWRNGQKRKRRRAGRRSRTPNRK